MSGQPYFRDPREFSVLQSELATVICVLNKGRLGGLGSVAVHSNSKGYRITLNGNTLAKGGTPKELQNAFAAAVKKASEA